MTTELEELIAMFEYHTDGYLIRRSTGRPCGKRSNHPDGHAVVGVGGRMLLADRVIYAIVTGKMPDGEIVHISGNRADNRIENLREVSKLEKVHNYKIPRTNSSASAGVYWYARTQKWRAQIRVNNRLIHLGYFKKYDDAVQARKKAKIRHHPSSPEAIKYASECF